MPALHLVSVRFFIQKAIIIDLELIMVQACGYVVHLEFELTIPSMIFERETAP